MSTRVDEWTVLSMIEWGTDYFKQKDIPDPRLSIEWLLAETLGVKRLDLYLKFDRPLSSTELEELRPLIKRRAQHEPLQYILGHTEFMNARISVSPEVLIPRIETEQLVEIVLEETDAEECSVIDLGTGSGCIPVALKMERPEWNVSALDVSESALEMARENARRNGTEIQFQKGDILAWEQWDISGPLDLVISNPPYVLPEEKKLLEKQVTTYEPDLALFCDDLDKMYGSIIRFSEKHLSPDGLLYLEIHEHYSSRIRSLFPSENWNVSVVKDYEKKDRFLRAERLV